MEARLPNCSSEPKLSWTRWLVMSAFVSVLFIFVFTSPTRTPGAAVRSEELRGRVREVCMSLNLSSTVTSLNLQHILVDDTRRILYCSVQKVASTTWKQVWMRMVGATPPHSTPPHYSRFGIHMQAQEHLLIQPAFEDVWGDMLNTYKKFLFVRHPFQRVVAAYRDKIENVTDVEDATVHQYLRNMYREKFGEENGGKRNISFPEFIRLITAQDEDQVLLWDSHWKPIHQLCNPCGIEYDFIGEFDNLERDSKYVLEWLGVGEEVGAFPAPTKSTHAADLSTNYLNQLSTTLRLSFANKYLLDYISFGYDLI